MKSPLYIFILFLISVSLDARQLEVGRNKFYTTIKSALKVCSDGDTVMVYSGVYKEGNLIIDKSIHFIGVGFPVLDGEKNTKYFL